MYPVSEQSFIHINPHTSSDDGYMEYVIIEPELPERKIMIWQMECLLQNQVL